MWQADCYWYSGSLARVSQGQSMIAGRRRDNTETAFTPIQMCNDISCAAQLEASGQLLIFQLQPNLGTDQRSQRWRPIQRCIPDHPSGVF